MLEFDDPVRLLFVLSLAFIPVVLLGVPALIVWLLCRLNMIEFSVIWLKRYNIAYSRKYY